LAMELARLFRLLQGAGQPVDRILTAAATAQPSAGGRKRRAR
jgi:hypothetical protein